METNEKLMTLLRLMDEPERMTEAQLEKLLADDEVREAYDLMADCKKVYQRKCKKAYQREKLLEVNPIHRGKETPGTRRAYGERTSHGWAYRIAAVFLGAAFLGGLAFAAWHAFSPAKGGQPAEVTAPDTNRTLAPDSASNDPVRFADVRLDSILTVVSNHYGTTVCFRDEEPRAMKLITTWNPADSLQAFIEHLNQFDYLRLTLQEDTIFVESLIDEEDGE